jgi:hypothetical protein
MSGNLFTPRPSVTSNERYKLQISDEDYAKIMRGQNWEAIVTDIETGVQYQARGAECSAGPRCFCDAIAEPVVEPRTETIYTKIIWPGVDLDGAERNSVVAFRLRGAAQDIGTALTLLATPKVELVDVIWDKRDGYGLVFETRHEGAAKAYCFDEMLRPDAEDYEPTPWTLES